MIAGKTYRVAARLERQVALWYIRLGSGSFTRGVELAHEAALSAQAEAKKRKVVDQASSLDDAAARLLEPWQRRVRASHYSKAQHLAWVAGRLEDLLGRRPHAQEARDVFDKLRELSGRYA